MNPFLKSIIIESSPVWDPVYAFAYRCVSAYRGPIPPFENRRRVGPKKIGDFFSGGRQAHECLKHCIETHQTRPLRESVVLDFGCGCGRVSQFFVNEVAQLHSSDVDSTAIAYLKKAFPGIRTHVNGAVPPLPCADSFFDVVYSWSVWTHLPYESQELWLKEMVRILKPGGVALITTQGPTVLRNFLKSPKMEEEWRGTTEKDLLTSGILYKDYPFLTDKKAPLNRLLSGIEGRYGLAFHSPKYIMEKWSDYLEIAEVQEASMHNQHDLVVARKRNV